MTPTKQLKLMEIAHAAAKLSKDTSTQVGAIIVGEAGEIRSMGYNGAPRGCSADEPGDIRGTQRPEKYFWFSHAEVNAITNAARVGTALDGCCMFVTAMPCMDCARAIVQAGIKQVVTYKPAGEFLQRWGDHIERSRDLFRECGVELFELARAPAH